MMAVGAKRADVRRLFALEGALVGFWGSLLALVIGNGLGLITNLIVAASWSRAWGDHRLFAFQLWLVPALFVGASLLGYVAGLYPAHRASH